MEFLWIRWYEPMDEFSAWETSTLDRVNFPPVTNEHSFDFVDPADVLRGCHIIPHFARGKRHADGSGVSACVGDKNDWRKYYVNRDLSPSIMPVSVHFLTAPLQCYQHSFQDLVSLDAGFDFVSYVSIGDQNVTLFLLYCLSKSLDALRPQLLRIGYIATPIMRNEMEIVHHSVYEPGSVPIYTQLATPSGKLDLAHQAYTITDHILYVKYGWPTPGIQRTTAFLAEYPKGHGSIDIAATLSQLFQPFQTSTNVSEFNGFQLFKRTPVVPELQSPVFSTLPYGQTLISPEIVVDSCVPSVNMTGCTMNMDDDDSQPDAQADSSDTLTTIQDQYSQWKLVLIHLRVEMRSNIALRKPFNPFLLMQANYTDERGEFVHDLFHQSLAKVGVQHADLDKGQELIHIIFSVHPHLGYIVDVGKWLSALLSLMKRAAAIAIGDGGLMTNFTLQNPCPFALQSDMCATCIQLMNLFMPPTSTRFPIATNSFVRFLRMGIAKSLVFYLVYRPTKSANMTRIMADINRPDFRVAPYLPPATLVFVGTCCYTALFSYLIDMIGTGGISIALSTFPPVSEVYDGLLRTAMGLFAQHGDPESPQLNNYLAGFCNLRKTDMSSRLPATNKQV
ncbi:hypothetical protein EDD22DRAFT_960020 [Suillus occidentalis]|nr:hypothetical protein EDD22DRAFT_960020 [Suillus occidentalis]